MVICFSRAVLKELSEAGHEIYLWSCRSDSPEDPYNWDGKDIREEGCLTYAERWFKERGIPLSTLPQTLSPKPFFDLMIDDISLGSKMKRREVEYVVLDGTGQVKKCLAPFLDWGWAKEQLKKGGYLQ